MAERALPGQPLYDAAMQPSEFQPLEGQPVPTNIVIRVVLLGSTLAHVSSESE